MHDKNKKMDIAKKLKFLLSRKNLTQSEFAEMLKTRQQVVQRWLAGTKPSHKSISKIAKELNISVEDLLDDNKNFSDIQINVNSKGTVNQTIQKEKDDLKDKEIVLLKKEIELLKKELELRKGRK